MKCFKIVFLSHLIHISSVATSRLLKDYQEKNFFSKN